jgi:hypothetical protein
MSTFEKIGLAIVGVAFATTLLLPDRKTAEVFRAAGTAFSQALRTAMGR